MPEPEPGPDPTPQEYLREIAIEAGIISKTTLDGDKLMWEGGDEIVSLGDLCRGNNVLTFDLSAEADVFLNSIGINKIVLQCNAEH